MDEECEVWCEDGSDTGEYKLTCEHPDCRAVVTADDEYVRTDKDLPNGWGECGEFLCATHSVGRTRA